MQKELDKSSGITPEIQAYIDSLVQNYESRITERWEQFWLVQAKRYLPQSEKFPAQGCLFNKAKSQADTGPSGDEPEMETVTYTRKRGRKPINPDLPREVIEYADDLPLYRIEKELARVGVNIQRTTLAN